MFLLHEYASHHDTFTQPLQPKPFHAPHLLALNTSLVKNFNLDPEWLKSEPGLQMLSHGQRQDGDPPVAMAYAGHQFGHFVPSLGDGRAMLVGELKDTNGVLYDLHLKGSGPTPFSRHGDGLAALGPVLREYIISEAMHALGIPTTRSLAAITTGEKVYREAPMPGAVLARISLSHIRVGTFQYFAAQKDLTSLKKLMQYTLHRLYPEHSDTQNPALTLLDNVIARQAKLIAQWMHVGFIHGVMNTDNTSIAGETLDFGPCAFLDEYNPDKTFSFIDKNGRYAYDQQPNIALWNLQRLAEALLPLIDPDTNTAITLATKSLENFNTLFSQTYLSGWKRKLGLSSHNPSDPKLISALLTLMYQNEADFTLTFRRLSTLAHTDRTQGFVSLFKTPDHIQSWLSDWRQRCAEDELSESHRYDVMLKSNPRIIPRNHKIEEMISSALKGDYHPFNVMRDKLSSPFSEEPEDELEAPPTYEETVQNTFCGT
ncbi:protein adenylyltransferase SelO [Swingsia samuiensis]|uniref:Protein nucleotidyltransferase YdiU n=1 Tax=Swingsia samuiensis TaxID=1293412 RepID=A0A4Y6UKW8_9PROT|nr:YdiU family protein [Swingsia samuiensis]QDH17116.1 YdiU family protein [Swingsia samuiensis]